MSDSPRFKMTDAGALPEDWDYVPISSVARQESGHTPARTEPSYWNGHIPWVSLHDTDGLDGFEIATTKYSVTQRGIDNSSARLLPRGTVVFSRTATVGKSTVLGREMATSQDFVNYVCGPRLNNRYLVYLFRSMGATWKRLMAGSTHQTIYVPAFKTLHIPVPPLREQQAIANALSDVDALLDGLDRLIGKKRDLKQAAMQQLLTGKTRLRGFSAAWDNVQLRSISRSESGGTPPISNSQFFGGDIPWVSIADMTGVGKCVAFTERTLSHAGLATSAAKLWPTGTILYAMYASLGECAIAACELCSSQAILGIQPYAGVDRDYLYYQLVSRKVRVRQTAQHGTQPNLNADMVRSFDIPLPPLDEQQAITAALADMDAEIDALKRRRAKTHDLKIAMMQELLTGKTRLVGRELPAAQEASASGKPSHNWAFNEAVVISTLVNRFGKEDYPLGRKRYTKLSYLLHRRMERRAEGYLKKAAGPYNPKTKYAGPEKIAKTNGYILQHKGPKGHSGFIAADNIAQAEGYFQKWYGLDVLQWLEQFRYKKNDELEVLATVDMATVELHESGAEVDVASVKAVIANHPEWEAKLDRAAFSDANIAAAIELCGELFFEEVH